MRNPQATFCMQRYHLVRLPVDGHLFAAGDKKAPLSLVEFHLSLCDGGFISNTHTKSECTNLSLHYIPVLMA